MNQRAAKALRRVAGTRWGYQRLKALWRRLPASERPRWLCWLRSRGELAKRLGVVLS